MKELFKKIQLVMNEVGYLQKDDSVKAGFETYRAISEEKVTSAVGAAMRKHGLVIYPIDMTEKREDFEVVRNSGKSGTDRFATVMVKYRIADVDSGESDIIVSVGTGVDTQDKAVGKAMTYAYKYMILRTFAIPTGEDPDRIGSEDQQPKGKAEKPAKTTAPEAGVSRTATPAPASAPAAPSQPEEPPVASWSEADVRGYVFLRIADGKGGTMDYPVSKAIERGTEGAKWLRKMAGIQSRSQVDRDVANRAAALCEAPGGN